MKVAFLQFRYFTKTQHFSYLKVSPGQVVSLFYQIYQIGPAPEGGPMPAATELPNEDFP